MTCSFFLNYHCLLGNLGNVKGMFFLIIPQRFLAIYSRVSGVRGIWGMFSEFLWRIFAKQVFFRVRIYGIVDFFFCNKEIRFSFPKFP